jgi:hypothetical protein
MKYASAGVLALLLLLGIQTTAQAQITLLDGSSLDGWIRSGDANWSLGDGGVEANSGNGHLITENSYSDFVLTLEFWVDDPANSGVFIRCADPDAISPDSCYEVNIYDQRADPIYRTGGIVNFAAPSAQIDAGGQWNTYEIRAEGTRLLITLNGTVTVDMEDSTYAEGPLTLQYGSGVVKFRNVQIQPL